MTKRSTFPSSLHNRMFTWAEAKRLNVSWNEIQRRLKTGTLERLSRGVYREPIEDMNDEEQFRVATLRLSGDSAVCLISALVFYGLSDLIPRSVWLLVSVEKHTRFTGVRLFRKRKPQFNIGIVQHQGYAITSIERTLAESLAERKRIGTNTAVEALRRAILLKKTTLSKVLDVAIQLGYDNRVRPYIEALA